MSAVALVAFALLGLGVVAAVSSGHLPVPGFDKQQ
jgi:hypothetical protein